MSEIPQNQVLKKLNQKENLSWNQIDVSENHQNWEKLTLLAHYLTNTWNQKLYHKLGIGAMLEDKTICHSLETNTFQFIADHAGPMEQQVL